MIGLDHDTFNAINLAATETGRSFSGECEFRLIQSLNVIDGPKANPDHHRRDDAARMQLDMLGAAMGAVFALTAVTRADDRGRSPGHALADPFVLAESIAAATRVVWAHTMPEDDVARLSAALAERLPKF